MLTLTHQDESNRLLYSVQSVQHQFGCQWLNHYTIKKVTARICIYIQFSWFASIVRVSVTPPRGKYVAYMIACASVVAQILKIWWKRSIKVYAQGADDTGPQIVWTQQAISLSRLQLLFAEIRKCSGDLLDAKIILLANKVWQEELDAGSGIKNACSRWKWWLAIFGPNALQAAISNRSGSTQSMDSCMVKSSSSEWCQKALHPSSSMHRLPEAAWCPWHLLQEPIPLHQEVKVLWLALQSQNGWRCFAQTRKKTSEPCLIRDDLDPGGNANPCNTAGSYTVSEVQSRMQLFCTSTTDCNPGRLDNWISHLLPWVDLSRQKRHNAMHAMPKYLSMTFVATRTVLRLKLQVLQFPQCSLSSSNSNSTGVSHWVVNTGTGGATKHILNGL